MNNFLVFCLFFTSAMCFASQDFNPNFRRNFFPEDKISQGRSLKDILAQHGGTLKPGKSVLTIDGILEEESSAAEQLAKLQRRLTEFKLATDFRVAALLAATSDNTLSSQELSILFVNCINGIYKESRSPLLDFFTDFLRERAAVVSLNTEALRLLSEKNLRAAVSANVNKISELNIVLLRLETFIIPLWQHIESTLLSYDHDTEEN